MADVMKKMFIGIDNGVSGTIGIIFEDQTLFVTAFTKSEQNYTKTKGNITRIDHTATLAFINGTIRSMKPKSIMCLVERPMVNPKRFKATTSALRALEATLNVVEYFDIPLAYIDSKEWQKELLPKGSKGAELKTASLDIGCRLFPEHREAIEKHGDADGILIAEYCRRFYR